MARFAWSRLTVRRCPRPLRVRASSAARTDARLRRPVRWAGDAHQAAHGLDERVVARERGAGCLAEAGDLAVDDPRVRSGDRVVTDAEPLERARPEVGDDHVCALAQAARELAAGVVAQVERDRAFVAVGGVVVGRTALGVGRRRPPPRVVPGRRLDLHHVGAEVAERLGDERAGKHAREVDDLHSGQCA